MNVSREERKLSMKKILSVITAAVMIFCLMPPVRSFALDKVSAVEYTANADNLVSKADVTFSAEKIDGSFDNLSSGNYYVSGNVVISGRIEVSGDVNLILTDGCSLTAKKGIHLKEGNSLTIYGQTNSTGTLTAETCNYVQAAIGGNDKENAGAVQIHGGKIIAQYDAALLRIYAPCGAAIGGGNEGNGGNVTVFGGTVDIQQCDTDTAGIGGGYKGKGGTVKIYGGDITASNGIGGGMDGANGDLYIYGGNVKATAQLQGDVSGGKVTVAGGEFNITVTGQWSETALVADSVTISGGKLTAIGKNTGINSPSVMISGGELEAYGENGALSSEPALSSAYDPAILFGKERYHGGTSAYGEKYFYVEKGSDHEVTFDYGNGRTEIYTIPATGKVSCPPPEKSGEAFVIWYSGDEFADFSKLYTDNVTFTAKWESVAAVDYIYSDGEDTSLNTAYIKVPPLSSSESDVFLNTESINSGSYHGENGVAANFYYVKGDIVINGNLYIQTYAVKLIITDGSSLTVKGRVVADRDLLVYGQKGGTGRLIINADSDEPALNYLELYGGNVEITNLKGPAVSGYTYVLGGSLTAESKNSPAIRYDGGYLIFNHGKLIAKSGMGKAIDYPEGKIVFGNKNIYYDIYTSPSANGSGKTKLADISQLYTTLENSAYAEFKPMTCNHSANTNTTCEGADCSVCGEYIAPTGHIKGDPVSENRTFASCTEGGSYDEVIYCTACGKEISRENKTIEPSEHTAGDPVIENEAADGSYDEVIYCSVCNTEMSRERKTSEPAEHVHTEGMAEVITMPTFTSAGSRVFRCTICGEILRTEIIPPITTVFTTATTSSDNASQVIYTEFPELKYSIEIKDGKAIISWDKIENVNKYVVYAIQNGKITELEKTQKTSFETDHKSGTGYLVRYMKNGVLSPKSKSISEDVISNKPIVAAVSGNDSVNLSWQDMGAEKYNIYKYADKKAVKIGEVKGTSVRIKDLTADTEYKFIVTAVIDGEETEMLVRDIVTIRTEKI